MRAMANMMKKTFAAVLACIMACVMFVTPVYASTSYFSKSTVKLNAYSGGTSSTSSLSSGSVPDGASITQVKLAYSVSSGTDPYTIYVTSPEGTVYSVSGPTSSTTVYISYFDGEDPDGTWKIYIKNLNYTTNSNILPVSTVKVSMTVYYEY